MKDGYVIGLDLGSSSIKAVLAKSISDGNIEIIGSEILENSDQILSGEIYNVNKTVHSITEIIRRLSHDLAIKNSDLHISTNITGQHIQFHFFDYSQERINPRQPISDVEIFELLKKAKEEWDDKENPILHQLSISFKVDNNPETNEPVGLIGSKISAKILFIVCNQEKLDILKDTIQSIKEFNFKFKRISFGAIGSGIGVLSEEEKKEGVILLDLGSGLTEISMYHKGQLKHAKVVNWGGNRISEDISTGLNISYGHAETIKIKFGSALSREVDYNEVIMVPGIAGRAPHPVSARNLAIIIEERMKELAAIILAEIKRIGTPKDFKSGIVIIGGGAQLPYINNLLFKYTGLECRIGESPIHAKTLKIQEDISNPLFASSVGLSKLIIDQLDFNQELKDQQNAPSENIGNEISEEIHASISKDSPQNSENPKAKSGASFKKLFNRMVDVVMGDDGDGDDY